MLEDNDRNVLGKVEEVAEAIKSATETANYTRVSGFVQPGQINMAVLFWYLIKSDIL